MDVQIFIESAKIQAQNISKRVINFQSSFKTIEEIKVPCSYPNNLDISLSPLCTF